MPFRKSFAIFTAMLLAAPPSWAVGHIHPGAYPHPFQDKIHHPNAAAMSRFGTLRAATLATSTGPKNVAVIIVQFPVGNAGLISGSNNILSLSNIDSYFTALKNYYKEASFNALSLNFKFFGGSTTTIGGDATAVTAGAITLAQREEYYGCGDEGFGCGVNVQTPTCLTPGNCFPGANGNYLIRDALEAARSTHGSTPSSVPAPGGFDAVIVVHAGNGNETSLSNGDIWSIFYSQDTVINGTNPVDPAAAMSGFDEGDVIPETETSGITSPLGVMCHEFGHSLGLPDEYNTTFIGGSSVVGSWEIMDFGPFDGNGANPAHPGAWDKETLGWAVPTVVNVSSASTATIGFIENSPTGLVKLPITNGGAQEYYLVEYRSRSVPGVAYDKSIPGDGLLVWHIDDAITSSRGLNATNPNLANTVNSGSPHYGISIVTADGVTISSVNEGDAGNAFVNGQTLISQNNYLGAPSGISLFNIRGVGSPQATFDLSNLAVSSGVSITRLVNFPNPAGRGYAHASGEGHTTIQFVLSRPAKDYSINLYTLSAELVRKVGRDEIVLNPNRLANDKWVYEFDWDLTNGAGAKVAPGVYLYLIRADGVTKSGKAVIIR